MNKQKRMFRFGLIDIVILLAVIACVFGVALRYRFTDRVRTETQLTEAEVSFLVTDIMPSSADAIMVGDRIDTQVSHLGTIKSTEIYNAQYLSCTVEGLPVLTEDTSRRDVRGVITVKGKMTSDGFMLNGNTFIAAGKEIAVKTPRIVFTLTVTGVRVIG